MIDVADSNTVYYYHFDGLGSVAALSDTNADIVERYSYDVFGEPNRVSDVNNPYMFTGRRYDSETANYYYRARYYKPAIGRFLQTDPWGTVPDGGELNWFDPRGQYDPLLYATSLNLYEYARNNPVTWNDPTGEFPGCAPCITCLVGSAVVCTYNCMKDPCNQNGGTWDCENDCMKRFWWSGDGGGWKKTLRVACWGACIFCGPGKILSKLRVLPMILK